MPRSKTGAWLGALLLAGLAGPVPASGAAAAGKADLAQSSVSRSTSVVAAGGLLEVGDAVRNRGDSVARRSRTRFYLSRDRSRGSGDIRLNGSRPVPRLRPGQASAGTTAARVPVTAPLARFHVLACADDLTVVPESRARNNCLASRGRVRITLPAGCRPRLLRLGVFFTRGPQRPGVSDPVTVGLPLNGVDYFGSGQLYPQQSLFMDCTLALALHEMATTLRARGITAVEHLGVYEYRCIAGTDPCVLSQHAHATAIDLHEFRDAGGETYNVEADWVIDAEPEETCSAPTIGPKDTLLHELACQWDAADLFRVILTPNYNADHRNHFHVDLTPGADFIE
jgi:Extensin-like protein C-terminus/CARDB